CHLMVEEPERHIRQVADAGGDSVTVHLEACADLPGTVALARELGLGAGLAVNPGTPVERALEAAGAVDLVLCMSIHPGYSGQAFMPEALDRLAALREGLPPEVLVEVDGGVKATNAREIGAAGADVLVVGSGIFAAAQPAAAYEGLAASLAVASAAGGSLSAGQRGGGSDNASEGCIASGACADCAARIRRRRLRRRRRKQVL